MTLTELMRDLGLTADSLLSETASAEMPTEAESSSEGNLAPVEAISDDVMNDLFEEWMADECPCDLCQGYDEDFEDDSEEH